MIGFWSSGKVGNHPMASWNWISCSQEIQGRDRIMGWYIRKAFSTGPVRLNLSKSGLGMSFGVKGARLGVGPRGAYTHLGRGGLYYRSGYSGGRRASAG